MEDQGSGKGQGSGFRDGGVEVKQAGSYGGGGTRESGASFRDGGLGFVPVCQMVRVKTCK